MIILALILLCNVGVPDGYPPQEPKGANGAKQYMTISAQI
jgi:hypothetical protein